MDNNIRKTALVTGAAGFIGYHISKRLLGEGWKVVGVDCMSDYYDVSLKERSESMLLQNKFYRSVHEKVETPDIFETLRGLSAGSGGEIQLADAIDIHAQQGSVETVRLNGRRFDCGSVDGFLDTIMHQAKR